MDQQPFQFNFKKKRPLWKDLLFLFLSVGSFWGSIHLFLNFNAFAQMADFKMNELQTSFIKAEDITPSEKTTSLDFKKNQSQLKPLIFQNKKLKPQTEIKKVFEDMPVYPSDDRIYIPRIKKNVPLIIVPNHQNWNQLEKNIQQGLQNGAVVHPISRDPGIPGNFFITGHSSYYRWDQGRFKDVFALLHEVTMDDIIEIYWKGKKYTYQVKAKEVIPPTETEVLNQPDDISIITLMTCTPVGTNKNRLVIIGQLIENIEE